MAATAVTVGLSAALALSSVGRRVSITLAALLTAAHAVDVEHFLRTLIVELSYRWKRRRGCSVAEVLEPHRAVHICWPIDLDGNAHMNNAKYARLLNYSRRAFWLQNGMWAACARRSPPANMVVTASALRFRRQIGCFERFLVVTRLLHWDDAAFYLEHRFESITDGFVRMAHRSCTHPAPDPAAPLHPPHLHYASGTHPSCTHSSCTHHSCTRPSCTARCVRCMHDGCPCARRQRSSASLTTHLTHR